MNSLYQDLIDGDFLSEWKPMIDSGRYMICPKDGKIHNTQAYKGKYSVDPDRDWMFPMNPTEDYHCDWFRDIAKLFQFVPEFCRSCWKIVVRPRTIVELFKLLDMQNKMVLQDDRCYCKCGIENRPFVFGNYGGYFYTQSLEAGLERYEQVRKMVDESINQAVPVILKRYCTEYELDFGPSRDYQLPPTAERLEILIKDFCHMETYSDKQPDVCKRRVMREWIKHAWSVGDHSVYYLTGNKRLVPEVCTYHDTNCEG